MTTNNYFTPINSATELQKYKTSLLETVSKILEEVLALVKFMKESLYFTTLYKYGNVPMTVYQAKAKKIVIILITRYQNITIIDNAKTTVKSANAYNDTKYGVNTVD